MRSPRNISELRQDPVTGEWVVVATGRAKRPRYFQAPRREVPQPKRSCPFERLIPSAHLVYDRRGRPYRVTPKDRRYLERQWSVQVVPNKFPAFGSGECAIKRSVGPYRWQDGVGFHEVVISRDHDHAMARLAPRQVASIIRAYRDRYLALKDEACVAYISIFHNDGREAGASITHPHSQIIATPVIPPDVGRSLRGSTEYFRKQRRCVHCVMLDFERRRRERIVYSNRNFLVLCPFVSRQAFETRIFPRRHQPAFEMITESEILDFGDVLQSALARIARCLDNPAYNFFIHTAPTADGVGAAHYHWHVEIVPKTGIWAGFEIGTGIEISTTAPEAAARLLRAVRV